MTLKFTAAALVVAAFGCARSATPPASSPRASLDKDLVATTRAPLVASKPTLRPVGVAQEMKKTEMIVEGRTEAGGIPLHGPDRTYLDQRDPSGWSGPSAPPDAIGGGPAEAEGDDEQK